MKSTPIHLTTSCFFYIIRNCSLKTYNIIFYIDKVSKYVLSFTFEKDLFKLDRLRSRKDEREVGLSSFKIFKLPRHISTIMYKKVLTPKVRTNRNDAVGSFSFTTNILPRGGESPFSLSDLFLP